LDAAFIEIEEVRRMRIQHETGGQTNLIRTYAPGLVVVNDQTYRNSLIVLPDRVIPDWPPRSVETLAAGHVEILAALETEVVLFGTGRRLRFPDSRLLAPLISAGMGFEIMDTGAACRTYNILMSEGRNVAAALLMIEE
jgi:uncharacterized protein